MERISLTAAIPESKLLVNGHSLFSKRTIVRNEDLVGRNY
jgi:hypothetical protein